MCFNTIVYWLFLISFLVFNSFDLVNGKGGGHGGGGHGGGHSGGHSSGHSSSGHGKGGHSYSSGGYQGFSSSSGRSWFYTRPWYSSYHSNTNGKNNDEDGPNELNWGKVMAVVGPITLVTLLCCVCACKRSDYCGSPNDKIHTFQDEPGHHWQGFNVDSDLPSYDLANEQNKNLELGNELAFEDNRQQNMGLYNIPTKNITKLPNQVSIIATPSSPIHEPTDIPPHPLAEMKFNNQVYTHQSIYQT